MGEDDEGRKMCKEVADKFRITFGPEQPHSKMTKTAAAYFFFEYLHVLINLQIVSEWVVATICESLQNSDED